MRGFTDWESYEGYVDALEELADRREPVLVTYCYECWRPAGELMALPCTEPDGTPDRVLICRTCAGRLGLVFETDDDGCEHRDLSEVYTITGEAWLRCDSCGAERRAS